MVLRKPYRFLIKNFKKIHLILLLLGSYLIYRTNSMLSFFNEYLESSSLVSSYNLSKNLFNGLVFLIPILVITILSSIIYLLFWKKKPIKFYLFNISIYVYTLFTYIYTYSVCKTLEIKLVDIRVLKIVDNLLLMLWFLQIVSTIFFFIRALGFDVKKFNFKDEKEFEILDKDSEEFELDVNFDSNNLKRTFNQKRRSIIYSYHENRFVANIFIGIFALAIFLLMIRFVLVKFKHYQIGEMFYSNDFSFQIKEAYMTDQDNKGKKITENILVITKIDVKGYKKNNKFNTSQLALTISDIPYNSTNKYSKELSDIGKTYKLQSLNTKEYQTYLVTFEIPKKYKNRTKYVRFYNSNKQYKNIKIRPKKTKEKKYSEVQLGNTLKIQNDYLNAELGINSFEISSKMKVKYDFTIAMDGYDRKYYSYEYLVPSYTDNYEKTILKLDNSFKLNNNKNTNIKDLFDLIYYNGSIEYKINGQTKVMKNINREVKPKRIRTKKVYLEVNKEIENASSIVLILNIRNNIYRYKIK